MFRFLHFLKWLKRLEKVKKAHFLCFPPWGIWTRENEEVKSRLERCGRRRFFEVIIRMYIKKSFRSVASHQNALWEKKKVRVLFLFGKDYARYISRTNSHNNEDTAFFPFLLSPCLPASMSSFLSFPHPPFSDFPPKLASNREKSLYTFQ